jgi:hypothetical protein
MTDRPSTGMFLLALLASLWIMCELLVVEEKLLACTELELSTAINTRDVSINKIHGPSHRLGKE